MAKRDIKFRQWSEKNKEYMTWEEMLNRRLWIDVLTYEGRVTEQYTNVDLKDGTEIYEGDILRLDFNMEKHGSDDSEIVRVLRSGSGFKFKTNGFEDLNDLDELINTDYDITVVGNIHTHPELVDM